MADGRTEIGRRGPALEPGEPFPSGGDLLHLLAETGQPHVELFGERGERLELGVTEQGLGDLQAGRRLRLLQKRPGSGALDHLAGFR